MRVVSISKKESDEFAPILEHYKNSLKQFGIELEDINIFNKDILNAQKREALDSQKEYSKALVKYRDETFSIALDPKGKKLDSFEFSKLFEDNKNINFLIGGAYGFEREFVNSCNMSISLSPLTMGHKIAKIVLFEQIYRGFCILRNHPYHK